MLEKRLTWLGTSAITAVVVFLAWKQVAGGLPQWSLYGVLGVVAVGSLLAFPYTKNEDGSPRRVFRVLTRGRRNASFVSGDHSKVTSNIQHTGRGNVTLHQGLTTEQLGELKKHVDDTVAGEVVRYVDLRMEVFQNTADKYTGQAYDQAMALGQQLITGFVEQLAARAPQNIESLRTVAMQQAILNAQTSAAIAGDEELTETLVDILIDKSGAEPRGFKGVVLTEALQVAGKLTTDQVNLLTALVIITRTITHNLDTAELVLQHLDELCRPLYGKIPTTNAALQYMSYTGVGDIERATILTGLPAIARNIIQAYDGVFTTGFNIEELPEEIKPHTAALAAVDKRYEAGDDRYRFKIASSQSLDKMVQEGRLNEPFLTHVDAMKRLITQRHLTSDKFMGILENDKPEFAQFIKDLDKISAATFMLSTVGIAIGQANWRRLQPDSAPAFDIYLTD